MEIRSIMGVGWVYYIADDGAVRPIRQSFTTAAAVDPFVTVSAGRSAFRVSDLLELAGLLDSLDGVDCAGNEGDEGAKSVKEIMPHV